MNKLIALFSFMLLLMAVNSSPGYAKFIYDITQFEQNGFVDDFSDGNEPAEPTYWLHVNEVPFFIFDSNREDGGLLELNSDDAGELGDERIIGATLNENAYFFHSGVGGYVVGSFEINDGFWPDTAFFINIANYIAEGPPPTTMEDVYAGIYIDSSGSIFAVWGDSENELNQDITSMLGVNTKITLKLSLNSSNQATAMFDFGSDSVFELTKDNFKTLVFYPQSEGDSLYTGVFGSRESVFKVTARCDINNDGKTGLAEAIYALQVVSGELHPLTGYTNQTFQGVWIIGDPSTDENVMFITTDNEGKIIEHAMFDQAGQPGFYHVCIGGSFLFLAKFEWEEPNCIKKDTIVVQGHLISETEGIIESVNGQSFTGDFSKVLNMAACQGTWSGQLADDLSQNVYNFTLIVDSNGVITSHTGLAGPVSGKMFSVSGKTVAFIYTGEPNPYSQIRLQGTISGNTLSGSYQVDDGGGNRGTMLFTKQ